MTRARSVVVVGLALGLVSFLPGAAHGQTTTTRTDTLIATTKAIVGASVVGSHTLDVTGTLGVTGAATFSGGSDTVGDYAATFNRGGTSTSTGTRGIKVTKTGAWPLSVGEFGPRSVSLYSPSSETTNDSGFYLQDEGGVLGSLEFDDEGVFGIQIGCGARCTARSNGGNGRLNFYMNGSDDVAMFVGPAPYEYVLGSQTAGHAGMTVRPYNGYSGNLGTPLKKWLSLSAAELQVETLIASSVMATIGGRLLVLPTTMLSADLAAAATTITVKHNNLNNGDRVYMEANGAVEFMAVTSAAGGSVGAYTYSVTRNLDGTGANDWVAGDAVANTGQAGNGFIDLYSVRGTKASTEYGPTIVGNVRLSSTYNDWAPRWAIGELNGLYGYSSTAYGVGFGDPSGNNLVIDATNGIRMRTSTTVLGQWSGSTLTLGQPLTSANTGQIVIDSDSIDVLWRNNANSATVTVLKIQNDGTTGYGLFTGNLQVSGQVWPDAIYHTASGDFTIGNNATGADIILKTANGSIRPDANEVGNLGTSSYRWAELYLKENFDTGALKPLVIYNNRVLVKNNGLNATTTCGGGQKVSEIITQYGIVTAVTCS